MNSWGNMPYYLKSLAAAALVVLVWFGIWSWVISADVARVKISIEYHYQALRANGQAASIRADAVRAEGFPFRFRVAVKGLTLSMIEGESTFAVSIPKLTLAPVNTMSGGYRVRLPSRIEVLYAISGSPPEHYRVTVDALPLLMLSAQAGGSKCGELRGIRCAAVAADAPLRSFLLKQPLQTDMMLRKPQPIILHMEMNGQSRDASFDFGYPYMQVYQAIPVDISRSLGLFVGVLREALVYKTGG